MSTNRLSWVGVGVVVLVVAGLVVRTLRHDAATQSVQNTRRESVAPHSPAGADGGAAASEADNVASGDRVHSSVQRAKIVLKAKGFYEGPIDSNFDPTVIDALKKFQASVGMRATGYLDMPTYKALGIEVKNPRP